uniref:Uncharacterized protein n=1 Tax=Lepeophtheirus salmonis TaxID=72036 RepID=A0A0K2UWW1_LEPSM
MLREVAAYKFTLPRASSTTRGPRYIIIYSRVIGFYSSMLLHHSIVSSSEYNLNCTRSYSFAMNYSQLYNPQRFCITLIMYTTILPCNPNVFVRNIFTTIILE